MAHLTNDLLKPRERVFTKPKRRWGFFSLALAVLTVAVLTVVYGAFLGDLLPDGRVMLAGGLVGAFLVPLLVAWRLRGSGLRIFATLNTLAALVLFTLFGRATDAALAQHGIAPLRTVADLVGPDDPSRLTDVGEGFVDLLRRLSLGRADAPAARPAARRPAASDGEPRADARPAKGAADVALAAARGPGEAAAPLAVSTPAPAAAPLGAATPLASIEDATGTPAEGTYSVVAAPKPTAAVEVPVTRRGRTVLLTARVNDLVDDAFTFDTGADMTAITPDLARRLGIDPASLEERRLYRTAGGPIEAPIVRLSSVAVGTAEVRDIDALVCESCPSNLLGRDFQEHFRIEIEAEHLRMHAR